MNILKQIRPALRRLPLLISCVALMVLGAFIAAGLTQAKSGGTALSLDPAPDFTVPIYSGGTGSFTLSSQQGHPLVLNFWGSWCPPCRSEFSTLQAAADRYKDQGLIVFGIDVQDTERDAKEFLSEQGTSFLTGPDLSGQILLDFKVANMPTTFFITRNGEIYKKWVGVIDETNLTTYIEELLAL